MKFRLTVSRFNIKATSSQPLVPSHIEWDSLYNRPIPSRWRLGVCTALSTTLQYEQCLEDTQQNPPDLLLWHIAAQREFIKVERDIAQITSSTIFEKDTCCRLEPSWLSEISTHTSYFLSDVVIVIGIIWARISYPICRCAFMQLIAFVDPHYMIRSSTHYSKVSEYFCEISQSRVHRTSQ